MFKIRFLPNNLHDFFHDGLGPGLFSREGVDSPDHLVIRLQLVLQGTGEQVVKVVLLGNVVEAVDATVPSFEALFQIRATHHVLIARPVECDPRLSQPLLRVEAPSVHATAAPWSRRATTPSSPRHRVCV